MPKTVKMDVPIPEPFELKGSLAPFPEKLRQEWKETYAAKYKEVVTDEARDYEGQNPEQQHARRHRIALREANRVFTTPECASYKDAKALEDWQVILRREEAGELKVVTIDAKKYIFPVA